MARFHSVVIMFYSFFQLLLFFIWIMFDVIHFLLFFWSILSSIYIWVCCCLIPPSYHLPPSIRIDGMQRQRQTYPNNRIYGVYIVVYCCSLSFCHFILEYIFFYRQYQCNPWIEHHTFVPLLSNVLYIVVLFWLATFWLIVVLKYI